MDRGRKEREGGGERGKEGEEDTRGGRGQRDQDGGKGKGERKKRRESRKWMGEGRSGKE